MSGVRAGVGLGSNVGSRLENLRAARQRIESLDLASPPVLLSRIFESPAVDAPPGSPDFLNAVMEIGWRGEPLALLRALRQIERDMGRSPRGPRNAPRVIDLDVLYVGDAAVDTDELTLPHPRMAGRPFVARPLADIRPDLAASMSTSGALTLIDESL